MRLGLIGGALLVGAGALVGWANYHIIHANQARLYRTLDLVPSCDVALVLGANPRLADGRYNIHFTGRIDAAATLYRSGKVRHLLVSGDNHRAGYDEPSMMKSALMARGIPAEAITCDYAGFRTLDSVIRAQRVFGLKRCIIVTQSYHNTRALEIARATGLDAYGFCAADLAWRYSFKTECREVLARFGTVLDLYVWHRTPHFLGKPEPIQLAQG